MGRSREGVGHQFLSPWLGVGGKKFQLPMKGGGVAGVPNDHF